VYSLRQKLYATAVDVAFSIELILPILIIFFFPLLLETQINVKFI